MCKALQAVFLRLTPFAFFSSAYPSFWLGQYDSLVIPKFLFWLMTILFCSVCLIKRWSPFVSKVFYWAKGDSQTRAFALWERDDDVVTTIKNLDQGTLYSFQIAAINKYGTGPKSAAVKAKTKTKVVGEKNNTIFIYIRFTTKNSFRKLFKPCQTLTVFVVAMNYFR